MRKSVKKNFYLGKIILMPKFFISSDAEPNRMDLFLVRIISINIYQ